MSGWIKLEKGLTGSLRFKRLLNTWRATNNARVTRNDCDVTLLLGACVTLWMYADSHIHDDNTIEATRNEINDLVGVPDFAESMPEQWLCDAPGGRLELPGFYEKNGSQDERRKSNAERQQRYRDRKKTGDALRGVTDVTRDVTSRNTSRQTDNQTDNQTDQRVDARATEHRANGSEGKDLTLSLREGNAGPQQTAAAWSDQDLMDAWAVVIATYPSRSGRTQWANAEHHWRLRIEQGATPRQLLAGVERYRAYVDGGGVSGPQYVLDPGKFFSDVDKPWAQPWDRPPSKAEKRENENLDAAQRWLAGAANA